MRVRPQWFANHIGAVRDQLHRPDQPTCERFLRYHFPVQALTARLLKTIRKQELIKAGDRVGVAVSGGTDSVALLLLLLELRTEIGIVLSVVHVNHKLRGDESEEDERFVATLAQQNGLDLHSRTMELSRPDSGIEAAARKLRYESFRQLVREKRVSKIATAHTVDDQAETVLLRMLRGSGIRGLSGIYPRLVLDDEGGEIVRPLLSIRRDDLQVFLREREQPWREDSSNRDVAFLRNRVRHRLLPLLKDEFGTAVVENLADLAEIARAEEDHWETGHPEILAQRTAGAQGHPIAIALLTTLSLAAQRRMIRAWLEAVNGLTVSFRLIEEVRDLAAGPAGKKIELPGGHFMRRNQRELCIELVE
jgi:tRNA(Ile)-lysidine synthase